MNISDYINIVAIILAPVMSVIVGQYCRTDPKKQDKMEIFKALMICDNKFVKITDEVEIATTEEDARYMLISCSAFVNYLADKYRRIQ